MATRKKKKARTYSLDELIKMHPAPRGAKRTRRGGLSDAEIRMLKAMLAEDDRKTRTKKSKAKKKAPRKKKKARRNPDDSGSNRTMWIVGGLAAAAAVGYFFWYKPREDAKVELKKLLSAVEGTIEQVRLDQSLTPEQRKAKNMELLAARDALLKQIQSLRTF